MIVPVAMGSSPSRFASQVHFPLVGVRVKFRISVWGSPRLSNTVIEAVTSPVKPASAVSNAGIAMAAEVLSRMDVDESPGTSSTRVILPFTMLAVAKPEYTVLISVTSSANVSPRVYV